MIQKPPRENILSIGKRNSQINNISSKNLSVFPGIKFPGKDSPFSPKTATGKKKQSSHFLVCSSLSPYNENSSSFRENDTFSTKKCRLFKEKKTNKKNRSRFSTTPLKASPKQEVVSITYEEIGLFPRSFSRVLDRFLKQVFSDVENLVIQEYRFYRYLFLTTLKCLLILFFVPFLVNFLAKSYVVRPLTEYFWNTKQTEIFLNSYQQKHAFAELKDFEEKLYFESLIYPKSVNGEKKRSSPFEFKPITNTMAPGITQGSYPYRTSNLDLEFNKRQSSNTVFQESKKKNFSPQLTSIKFDSTHNVIPKIQTVLLRKSRFVKKDSTNLFILDSQKCPASSLCRATTPLGKALHDKINKVTMLRRNLSSLNQKSFFHPVTETSLTLGSNSNSSFDRFSDPLNGGIKKPMESIVSTAVGRSPIGLRPTANTSLFVYQTIEADKNIQQRYQAKTIELAQRYNDQSIEAVTNFFGDIVSLATLFYLLYVLEIQINITQSFLLEVFFGLDDSKKSLLILLITDLLVGYHSSNLWELFFELFFNHYGLPESQTGIFLLVATLPVLLDVLFKYLIFRHLNRSSPATVATYHAIIE